VYVTSGFSRLGQTEGKVSQYTAAPDGTLSAKSPAIIQTGVAPTGIALSSDGKSAYTANSGDNTVSQFTVAADGALSPMTSPTIPAGAAPAWVAVSPDGAHVYVANENDGTVSEYSTAPGGALAAMSPAAVTVGGTPVRIVMLPSGQSLYVVTGTSIVRLAVGADGTLSGATTATTLAGATRAIAINPDGQTLYVATGGIGTLPVSITPYAIGTDGTLSAGPALPVSAPSSIRALAVSPNGTSLYAVADTVVFQFSTGTGGTLSAKSPASLPLGAGPNLLGIAVSADGTAVYAANNQGSTAPGSVLQFAIGAGGALSALSPSSVTVAVNNTQQVAVSPLPPSSAPGLSVQASGPVSLGGSITGSALLSGAAGASGTVTFNVYGPGDSGCSSSVASSTAQVSGNGTYSSAPFTPAVPGQYSFRATYSGDGSHAAAGPTDCSAPGASVSVGALAPVVTTNPASGVTGSAATMSGSINPGGAATTYVFEYGTTLAFGAITTPSSVGAGASPMAASASLSGLTDGATYFYRLVATNAVGTSFGPVGSFKTGSGSAPSATTGAASGMTTSAATLAASVNPHGQTTVFTFEYGTSTAFGQISSVVALDDAQAPEPVSVSIAGLQPNTTYYYRVVASNGAGTATGSVMAFNTGPGGVPAVTTGEAGDITTTTATLTGTVDPHGSQTAFTFAYGTSAAHLDAITTIDSAGSTQGPQSVRLPVAGLLPGTSYVYRLVATNANGTALGTVRSLNTPAGTE
jgi:DNA-binding beta-propeller fold protein YncE